MYWHAYLEPGFKPSGPIKFLPTRHATSRSPCYVASSIPHSFSASTDFGLVAISSSQRNSRSPLLSLTYTRSSLSPKIKPLGKSRFIRHQATIHVTDNMAVLGLHLLRHPLSLPAKLSRWSDFMLDTKPVHLAQLLQCRPSRSSLENKRGAQWSSGANRVRNHSKEQGSPLITHVNATIISFLEYLSLSFSNDSPANFGWGSTL